MSFKKINLEQGHILVYGQTMSGKTFFTKHILDVLKPDNIYVFTTTNDWTDYNNYHNFNRISTILNEIEYSEGSNIIVFDDFNDQINTSTDKHYIELFTRGRHKNIRVINLAHNSKAIGPTVRANTRYVFMMSTINLEESNELAKIFYKNEKF